MSRKDLEIFLYKNKLNTKSIIDLLPQLSSSTIKGLIKDLVPESLSDFDSNNILYIHSDGGCRKNGKDGAVAGYSVFFTDDEDSMFYQFNTTKQIITEPTNNKAELSGIKYVFKTINENKDLFKNKPIVICTDSMYSINCIEKWSTNWQKNNWRNAKGEPVKNQEIIKQILTFKKELSDIDIKFRHIFSHVQEPEDKSSLQYKLWYGNNKVDTNINKLF